MTSQRPQRLRRARARAALMPSACTSPMRSVSHAVWHTMLGAALLAPITVAVMPGQAAAQSVGDSRSYSIPAGPLDKALTAFAAASGVMLSFEPTQVQGLPSPGLQGEHTVWGGFSLLLQGTGLEAQPRGQGSYVLRKAAAQTSAADAAGALPGVTVRSRRAVESEGTGSYTSIAPLGTATKLGMTLRETPQSVTVITRQRMEDQGLTQMSDVFRQTVGLTFVQNGSQGTDSNSVYSRGFAVENFQIDGVPQLSSWLTLTGDLSVYDRIEVLRGATGLTNGVGSPAATINLVRKRPTAEFQAHVQGTVGSWDHRRLETDISSPLNDTGSVRGRIVAAVQNNESWIDRLEEEKRLFYGIVEIDLRPGTKLTAGTEYQKHDADDTARNGLPLFFSDGSPTRFSRSMSGAAAWSYSYQTQQQAFASLDHQFDSGWAVKANLNISRRKYDDLIGYALRGNPDRITGAGLGVWANRWNSTPTQKALDLYVSGPFELLGRKHELVAGYNISRTTYDAPGYAGWPTLPDTIPNVYDWDGTVPGEPLSLRNRTSTTHFAERQSGAYATARFKPTDVLSVIVGARVSDWDQNSRRTPVTGAATVTSRTETGVLTPYAGLVVDVTDNWSVYASYADIFKPQSNKNLQGDFLDPLKGKNYEVGTKGAFFRDRLNVSLAVFEVRQDNLAVALTGRTAPDGSQAYEAAQGTRTRGYEAELSGELAKGWQVGGGYTLAKARNSKGVRLNTQVPMETFKLFTTYKLSSVGRGLTVGGAVNYQSEIYALNAGPSLVRFTQPAYAVVDLMARYPFSDKLSASVNLGNAFNKTYYTSTSSTYYGAPRNVNLTVKYQF